MSTADFHQFTKFLQSLSWVWGGVRKREGEREREREREREEGRDLVQRDMTEWNK